MFVCDTGHDIYVAISYQPSAISLVAQKLIAES
jgi:hypothetical protein